MGFYLLFPLSFTLYALGTEDQTFCYQWDSVISFFLVIILVIFGIGFTVKMWFVHDAYFLKTRLKIVAIVICGFGIPYVVVGEFLALIPPIWYEAGSNVLFVITICSVWAPTIVWYLKVHTYQHGSTITTSGATSSDHESIMIKGFENDPRISALLKRKEAFKFIEEYLIHYQYAKLSDYLNFWKRLQAFKSIAEKKALAGHASLIYQKYLTPDAYIYIDCFTTEQRETVNHAIEATMDATSDVDSDLFDDLLDTLEPILGEHLFIPFLKSEYYTKLRKTKGLEDFVEVEVEVKLN